MFSSKSGLKGLVLAAVFVLIGGIFLIVAPNTGVDANAATEADSYGYTWIDSKDPDPKITYNWIDATGGSKVSIDGDDVYTTINVPFAFPFYGSTYNSVTPTSNGILCISNTGNYYYTNENIGSSSSFDGFIAPWWDDLSAYSSRGSYVYSLGGTDTDGTNYFVIEWHDIMCPYSSSGSTYAITFEVILYENGVIKIQYKDATSSSNSKGSSATVGIEPPTGGMGVSYSYNSASLEDGLAIQFQQYFAEIDDENVQFSQGFGDSGDIYAAMAGTGDFDYWAKVPVECEKDIDALTTLVMTIGYGQENVRLTYDFRSDTFTPSNDPSKMVVLNADDSSSALDPLDPIHKAVVEFHYDFNLNTGLGISDSNKNIQI